MSNEITSLENQAKKTMAAGQNEAAIKAWERILAIDPGHVPTLVSIGKFSLLNGDLVSAKRAYQRVVDLDGRKPEWEI